MSKVSPKRQRLAEVPLFRACSDDELSLLEKLADEVHVTAEELLIQEGGIGHEFFVIAGGEALVRRRGREVARLGPGDFFGELALLGEPVRDAEVVASTEMDVIVIGSRDFHTLLASAPSLTRAILRGTARRLQEADLAQF